MTKKENNSLWQIIEMIVDNYTIMKYFGIFMFVLSIYFSILEFSQGPLESLTLVFISLGLFIMYFRYVSDLKLK